MCLVLFASQMAPYSLYSALLERGPMGPGQKQCTILYIGCHLRERLSFEGWLTDSVVKWGLWRVILWLCRTYTVFTPHPTPGLSKHGQVCVCVCVCVCTRMQLLFLSVWCFFLSEISRWSQLYKLSGLIQSTAWIDISAYSPVKVYKNKVSASFPSGIIFNWIISLGAWVKLMRAYSII